MSIKTTENWQEANQRYLTAALAVVREMFERHIANTKNDRKGSKIDNKQSQQALQAAKSAMPAPAALDVLCLKFGLSSFERNLLLLCASMELDSSFAALFANAQGDPQRAYPTFSLAISTLPEPHWSAITPHAPLRYWRLIEVGNGNALTMSPLRIDESALHFLTGLPHIDDKLMGLVEPVRSAITLLPSQVQVAQKFSKIWSQALNLSDLPVILLCGDGMTAKRDIATVACSELGLIAYTISAHVLPTVPGELEAFMRLWERDATLLQSALLLDCDEIDMADVTRRKAIDRLIKEVKSPLIIAGRGRRSAGHRNMITFDIPRPSANEQCNFWQSQLGTIVPNMNGQIEALVSQFNLNAQTIHAVCTEALATIQNSSEGNTQSVSSTRNPASNIGSRLPNLLWNICRAHARPRIEELAQRLEHYATWDDLVLPEPQLHILRDMTVHVKQRAKVYETWGFSKKGTRGLGISVLPSDEF